MSNGKKGFVKGGRQPPPSAPSGRGGYRAYAPPSLPFKHPKSTPQYAQEAISYGGKEASSGVNWVDGRATYKKTISIGALPNTGSANTAHGISGLSNVIRVSGYATDGTNHYPLPYGSPTGADNIEVAINATNIVITTGKDRSGETGYIVLEFTK